MAFTDNMITFHTPICFMCGNGGTVRISSDAFTAWQNGNGPIQEFFPDLDLDTREQMISGTHPACWTEMFGE